MSARQRYLVVYDVEGDVYITLVEATREQADDMSDKASIYHVVALPLGSSKCSESTVEEMMNLEDDV
jgi:hypothetical protein